MPARIPKQLDLGEPQRPSCSALRNFPQEAVCEEENTLGDGN